MRFSSVLVGEESSKFGNEISESEEDARKNEEGAAVFCSSWLPGNESKYDYPFLFFFFSKLSCSLFQYCFMHWHWRKFLCCTSVWACFAFRIKQQPEETKRKRKKQQKEKAIDDDVVEELVLSSDEDMPSSHTPSAGKNVDADHLPSKRKPKQKHRTKRLKKN